MIDGATVTIDGPHAFNSVHLVNGAILTHSAALPEGLDLTVTEQVIVSASTMISADGKGYVSDSGPGAGSAGNGGGGGGYGGVGGNGSGGTAGSVYGSITEPSNLGSGGGLNTHYGGPGGTGGGAVRLTVGGTLQVEGELTADGNDGLPNGGAGGSGGSLYLTVGTLAGAGVISADGGNGQA